ncbi:MAG: protein kinase [Planctomycetota bacterium]|nr:protein kinase [Planctomycetota bacterium]
MARVHRIGEPDQHEAKAVVELGKRLPDDYFVFHNFELTTGRGLPYEYDICVVAPFAVWHVEVKGYRGTIRGDQNQWVFENGGVMPSPIPLANKKSKILASKLRDHARRLEDAFVDTVILLTDDKAKVRLKDDQSGRVIHLSEAADYLSNPRNLPVQVNPITHLHDMICEVLFNHRPSQKVKQVGLYEILEKLNQTENRTVFLAKHRFIRTRPKTILKVFHFDAYQKEEEKRRQIEAIFHDSEAMRHLGAHPNLIDTSDMFAWDDTKFVQPSEYIESGRPLELLLQKEEDRQITWKEKADLVAKMARGLRHAHDRGVIHRDLRPWNVVVAPGGVCKLVNFDLALVKAAPGLTPRDLEDRLDPRYCAPEVWQDPGKATPASDIYSLGIVFYQLITSQTPYEDIEQSLKISAETPLDRDLLLKELSTPGSEDFMESPHDAVEIIARMTRRDPKARYQSVDEVMEDLTIIGDTWQSTSSGEGPA